MTQEQIETQSENKLVRNILAAFIVSGAASQPLGSFIPFLRDTYGLSYDLSGVLLSFQSIGNLLSLLAAGLLPVYLGRRRSILCTSVWMGVAYLIFTVGLGTPAMLIAAFLMTGIARGGNSGFTNTMMGTLPEPKATKGYNLLHGSYALGALLSPLLLVGFTALWPKYGWRITAGLLALMVAGQLAIYLKMPLPDEHPAKSIKNVDRSFFREKRFWLAASMLFFYISAEYAIMGWMVTYYQDIGILSPNMSQIMNSLLWLVIFAGRLFGAFITGKVSQDKLLLADGAGFFLFFLLIYFSRSALPLILGIIGVGLFMSTIYPTAFAFGSGCIKGNDTGTSALIFISSIGGIITPALVGLVAEHAGIRAGIGVVVVFTALLVISILLSIFSSRKQNQRSSERR